jgi:hypothetical protein
MIAIAPYALGLVTVLISALSTSVRQLWRQVFRRKESLLVRYSDASGAEKSIVLDGRLTADQMGDLSRVVAEQVGRDDANGEGMSR